MNKSRVFARLKAMMPITKIIPGIGLAVLTSCAAVEPYVQELNIVSVPDETKLGNQIATEISQTMTIVKNQALTDRVTTMGERLTAQLPRKDFQYKFYVVQDNSPNAFTIPGGSIYVHTGLLDFARSDAEVAGVLAHEIGHAYDRHPAKAMTRQYGVDYLTGLLFKNDAGKAAAIRKLALGIGKEGLLTRYGRQDEYKADEIGFNLLKRAGYPTDGLLQFLRRLQSVSQGREPFPFLSTHPPTPDRVARLEQFQRGGTITTTPQGSYAVPSTRR